MAARSSTKGARRSAPLALAAVLSACNFSGSSCSGNLELDCDRGGNAEALNGTWQLEAEGRRTGCATRTLNGDITLTNERPIVVRTCLVPGQVPPFRRAEPPLDELTARIAHHEIRVSSSDGVRNVSVNGSCVSFTLGGTTEHGDVSYRFEGMLIDGNLEGNFEGTGPEPGCVADGKFTVSVSRSVDLEVCPGTEVEAPRAEDAP